MEDMIKWDTLTGERAEGFKAAYFESETRTLGSCITSCSDAKKAAFKRCEDIRLRMGGKHPRILSESTFHFVYGYIFGESLHVITPEHNYQIDL